MRDSRPPISASAGSSCSAYRSSSGRPLVTWAPTTDPADVPTTMSAPVRSMPARASPVRMPSSHAIPVMPPPPRTSADVPCPVMGPVVSERPWPRARTRRRPAGSPRRAVAVLRGCYVSISRSGLAARELLAERLQRLVGGERAAGVATGLRLDVATRGVRGGLAGLGLGDLGVRLLLDVLLPAGVRLGVLVLPDRTLLVEALEPLARLGVEALGVDVVALLVVGRGHAVERGVELLHVGRGRGVVGLLERQRDPATLEVDVDDLDHDVVVDLDDLLGDLDVTLGELGDVHQALDALLDADERAEGHQLGDLARHDLADLVGAGEVLPRVLLRRLQRQGDTLAVHVHVEDLDGDLVAHGDDLGRVVDVLPRQLGDVDETVDAAEVHERTEVDDRGHDALADLALLELLEERGANLGLGLLEPGTARQDHVVAVLVELDDLRLERLADVRLQVAHAAHLDQRRGQEAAQADVEDETTLDDLDDGALDDAVLLLDLLD